MPDERQEFARAFGDALAQFLANKGLSQSDAANQLRLGKKGKARLSAYCHESTKGKRPVPGGEVLYRICAELGFEFKYKGYRISAETLNGHHPEPAPKPAEQLPLEFRGQFNLTDQKGTVYVSFKRPPGRVEVSLRLRAAS